MRRRETCWYKPSRATGVRGTVQRLTILRSVAPVPRRILCFAVIGVHGLNACAVGSSCVPCRPNRVVLRLSFSLALRAFERSESIRLSLRHRSFMVATNARVSFRVLGKSAIVDMVWSCFDSCLTTRWSQLAVRVIDAKMIA